MKKLVLALVVMSAIAGVARAADLPTAEPAPAAPPSPAACASVKEFVATDCALTWNGITLYGVYDVGVGWVSHGLPENGYNYEGESLVNRNGNHSQWLLAPNNLQQTGLGIKGKIEFMADWYAVFNASTGINPQSGQLANMAATNTTNNGLPRSAYSETGDGARAGQAFNDELYAGGSSTYFGTLTFGRQRALGTDAMLAYDPAGGAYSFSYIGYNGTMAGGGDTEDTRWDNAMKYRVTYGPVHFGAMYKFVDGSGGCYSASATWTAATCTPEEAHNSAYGFDLGGEYAKFSADVVFQRVYHAISVLNPLLGPESLTQPYYEHIQQFNPSNPLGIGASAQGGYLLSGVEDKNLDRPKIVQIWWTGVKYAYDIKTDITAAWYHQQQNDFRLPPTCSTAAGFRASCAGTLNEFSLYADHHFTKRFDAYAGIAYSNVSGGLAIAIPHGPGVPYLNKSNTAPTVGARFTF